MSAAAAWFDGSLKKLHEALADVEPGTSVGVVTLLGSLCPVTRGHMRAFIEARRILLGEVKIICGRPSRAARAVWRRSRADLAQRIVVRRPEACEKGRGVAECGKAAGTGEDGGGGAAVAIVGVLREGETVGLLRQTHPHLQFVHFYMNGGGRRRAL